MKPGGERSCARRIAWLLLAGAILVAVAAVGAAAAAWQWGRVSLEWQADEITRLRAQVEELTADSRQVDAQATLVALADRLTALERGQRGLQLAAEATAEANGVAGVDGPAANMPGAWDEVVAGQAALTDRVDALERQVAALAAAAHAIEPDARAGTSVAHTLPGTVRLTVEAQKQSHSLSCESSAASMAARYHGVDVGEEDMLAALPRNDNPHLGFRGNVDGSTGGTADYGVYAGPVAAVLRKHGLDARMVEGGLAGIRAALARSNPVVAWITFDCLASTPVTVTVGGEQVVLVPYQHAVVVTGYDTGGVWANDPWDGGQDYYSAADFERALSYFGQMAIEVAAVGE